MILLIDDKVKKEIQRVKKEAAENCVSLKDIQKYASGELIPNNDHLTFKIEPNTTVTYTHEVQPGGFVFRHMSMALHTPEGQKTPSPEAVQLIMNEFDFVNELNNCVFWVERVGEKSLPAINVIEPLDGDFKKLPNK